MQMLVSRVEIFAAEEHAGVLVAGDARRIWSGRPLVSFISGVEHQFRAIQLEPCPIAVVPGLRRGVNFESQHVAVEANRGRHVKDLKQRSDAVNVHGRSNRLSLAGEYIKSLAGEYIKIMIRRIMPPIQTDHAIVGARGRITEGFSPTFMAFKVFLSCGTDPGEQVAAWRLQTLATSYGMHVSVPNRNGPLKAGIADQVRRAIDQSDCVLAIITENVATAVAHELNYALSRGKLIVPVVKEGISVPAQLRKLPIFYFSPWNSGPAEAQVIEFLRKQKIGKENVQSMAALILAGLGVFLLAALSEK
jgi:hypothetical protein